MPITSLGIGSGLDIESLVSELVILEGEPTETRLNSREADFQAELSGLGTFRSGLSSFQNVLEPLKNSDEFGGRNTSSGDEELFTVSASGSVAPGDYDVEVVRLARGHKIASPAFVDSATFIGTGTLEIFIEPNDEEDPLSFSVEINDLEAATLADIRDGINNSESNTGVVASIINAEDGSHLILTGTLTGESKTIKVTASGGDGALEQFIYDPEGDVTNMSEVEAALDAEIRIDSFTHFSSTNRVTTVIDGLTIDLVSADPGTTAKLSIGLDQDQARALVDDFVSGFNSLITTNQGLTSYDPDTSVAGILQGDSIVPALNDRLLREFNATVPGTLTSLRDLGISISLEGTLEVDDEVLDAVLSEGITDVRKLFSDPTDGVAVRFDAVVDEYLKADGLLDARVDGLEISIEGINDERERLNARLISVEERYRDQFIALDSLVAQLNSTSSFLTTQLANLPTVSYSTGS